MGAAILPWDGTEPAPVGPHYGILWALERSPMAKQDDYRTYAIDAVRLASNASSTAKKTMLLALAERWLALADAQDRRAKADHGFRVIKPDGLRREHQNSE